MYLRFGRARLSFCSRCVCSVWMEQNHIALHKLLPPADKLCVYNLPTYSTCATAYLCYPPTDTLSSENQVQYKLRRLSNEFLLALDELVCTCYRKRLVKDVLLNTVVYRCLTLWKMWHCTNNQSMPLQHLCNQTLLWHYSLVQKRTVTCYLSHIRNIRWFVNCYFQQKHTCNTYTKCFMDLLLGILFSCYYFIEKQEQSLIFGISYKNYDYYFETKNMLVA